MLHRHRYTTEATKGTRVNPAHKSTLALGTKVALLSSSTKRWRETVLQKGLEKAKIGIDKDNTTQSHELLPLTSKGMFGCQPHRKPASCSRFFPFDCGCARLRFHECYEVDARAVRRLGRQKGARRASVRLVSNPQ